MSVSIITLICSGIYLCWLTNFYVNLTQAGAIVEEDTST